MLIDFTFVAKSGVTQAGKWILRCRKQVLLITEILEVARSLICSSDVRRVAALSTLCSHHDMMDYWELANFYNVLFRMLQGSATNDYIW